MLVLLNVVAVVLFAGGVITILVLVTTRVLPACPISGSLQECCLPVYLRGFYKDVACLSHSGSLVYEDVACMSTFSEFMRILPACPPSRSLRECCLHVHLLRVYEDAAYLYTMLFFNLFILRQFLQ